MSALGDAYAQERARLQALPALPPRQPLLAVLGRLAARVVERLPRARTTLLSVGGFGLLSTAAWMVAVPAGLAAAGVSLLVLEYLSGDDDRRR